jgi:hypothetical protein
MVPSVLGCATKVDAVKPTIRIRREFHAHELVREPAVRVHPTHTIRRVEVKMHSTTRTVRIEVWERPASLATRHRRLQRQRRARLGGRSP